MRRCPPLWPAFPVMSALAGYWAGALAGVAVFLIVLGHGNVARAQAPAQASTVTAPNPEASRFGQERRYRVGGIEVQGNRRTDTSLILAELGIAPGDVLTADDPRVPLAELRLRSLGHFVQVRLRIERFEGRRGEVMLIVEVEERGTLILNAIHLGSSEATRFWGGVDVSETNLLGRGILVGAGGVVATTAKVPEAQAGRAFTLRAAGPVRRQGLLLTSQFLYSRGSEFFQAVGRDDDVDPNKWTAVNHRRVGATVAAGRDLTRNTRLFIQGHIESIDAQLPTRRTRDLAGDGSSLAPLPFDIRAGASRLGSLTALLDLDTRSDPVMPSRGHRLVLSLEAGLPIFGSSYSYAKGVAQGAVYVSTARGHVVAFHGFGGAILGEAPFFTQFFVGDLNFLLPPRALGLNFSTLPSRNVFGTNISGRRYESFAARALIEYAVPLWRGGGFAYRGDVFLAFGAFGLAGLDDLRARDTDLGSAIPVDLTADFGLRLDTHVGIFTLSIGNALGRLPL